MSERSSRSKFWGFIFPVLAIFIHLHVMSDANAEQFSFQLQSTTDIFNSAYSEFNAVDLNGDGVLDILRAGGCQVANVSCVRWNFTGTSSPVELTGFPQIGPVIESISVIDQFRTTMSKKYPRELFVTIFEKQRKKSYRIRFRPDGRTKVSRIRKRPEQIPVAVPMPLNPIADLDGDRVADPLEIVSDESTTGGTTLMAHLTSGVTYSVLLDVPQGLTPDIIQSGIIGSTDVDRDGDLDVAVWVSDTRGAGPAAFILLKNDGSGRLVQTSQSFLPFAGTITGAVFYDFGRIQPEILFGGYSQDVLTGAGFSFFATSVYDSLPRVGKSNAQSKGQGVWKHGWGQAQYSRERSHSRSPPYWLWHPTLAQRRVPSIRSAPVLTERLSPGTSSIRQSGSPSALKEPLTFRPSAAVVRSASPNASL